MYPALAGAGSAGKGVAGARCTLCQIVTITGLGEVQGRALPGLFPILVSWSIPDSFAYAHPLLFLKDQKNGV